MLREINICQQNVTFSTKFRKYQVLQQISLISLRFDKNYISTVKSKKKQNFSYVFFILTICTNYLKKLYKSCFSQ